RDRAARAHLAREVIGEIGLSVILAGVTAIAGFLSLALSPIVAIRELGLFAGVGIAFATGIAITVTPALLVVLPGPALRAPASGGGFERLADALARFALRYRTLVIAA